MGPLGDLVPDDQVVIVVDRVLDPSWLPDEVADCCGTDDPRPGNGIVRCASGRILKPHGKPGCPGVPGAGARRSGVRGRERIDG